MANFSTVFLSFGWMPASKSIPSQAWLGLRVIQDSQLRLEREAIMDSPPNRPKLCS
jgi:hypothetical protein